MTQKRDYFVLSWNLGAVLSALLPFLTWLAAALLKGGDNGEEQSSSWWSWGNGQQQERGPEDQQGKGAIVFVYIWSLLAFGLIVWYGNAVFRNHAHPLPLLSALVVFWNACLMCLLLVCSLGVSVFEWIYVRMHAFELILFHRLIMMSDN
jgi:hypothetical protein